MKILIEADGSDYTRRMPAQRRRGRQMVGFTVIHCILAAMHRAAAFVGRTVVLEHCEHDAEAVLAPIRAFFAMPPRMAHGYVCPCPVRLPARGGTLT